MLHVAMLVMLWAEVIMVAEMCLSFVVVALCA
jgi:hypothetical protein